MKKYQTIHAITERGGWVLAANDEQGKLYYPQEGKVHPDRDAAFADAAIMWPSGSPWLGERTRAGWRIVID